MRRHHPCQILWSDALLSEVISLVVYFSPKIVIPLLLLLPLGHGGPLDPAGVMFALGAGESLYDIAINAEGSMLEVMGGRAVLSGFHAMFSVGATQLAMPGTAPALAPGVACAAVLDKFCKKSKPGTNLPKPKADESLMVSPEKGLSKAYPKTLSNSLTHSKRMVCRERDPV